MHKKLPPPNQLGIISKFLIFSAIKPQYDHLPTTSIQKVKGLEYVLGILDSESKYTLGTGMY